MNDNAPIPIFVSKLTALNEYERSSIRIALEEYIFRHGPDKAWSQRVVLEDMLPFLMWGRP